MSIKFEGKKFSDFVSGMSEATDAQRAAAKAPISVNGSNAAVPLAGYEGGRQLSIVSNPEYAYAVVDSNGVFLFGVKADGSVEWQKGVPEPVKSALENVSALISAEQTRAKSAEAAEETRAKAAEALKVDKAEGKSLINETFANSVSVVTNDEYVFALVDNDKKFLFGVKADGSFDFQKGKPSAILDEMKDKVDVEEGKTLVNETFANSLGDSDNNEFVKALLDSCGRIIHAVQNDGRDVYFNKPKFTKGFEISDSGLTDLDKALKKRGLAGGKSDWSDSSSLHIPKPACALVNFKNITSFPTGKEVNLNSIMEFWDLQGNYFKKNVILNAQGRSTMALPKKNIAVDICNDEWIGDDTFALTIGNWIEQDSFHIKAYYNDFFKGLGCILYDVFREMENTRGTLNAPWKVAKVDQSAVGVGEKDECGALDDISLQADSGAVCHPLGFPCVVYIEGEFMGCYSWQLKKDRDNYAMKKSNAKHIHIDGNFLPYIMGASGNIDWAYFEVRNPKNLVCMDGSDYDGENPQELIDATSSYYDSSNKNHKNSSSVKSSIIALSNVSAKLIELVAATSINDESVKEYFESVFDVDNIIDTLIFADYTYDPDSWDSNTQWITYDGVKWFACPYDLDNSCGFVANNSIGGRFQSCDKGYSHINNQNLPYYYVLNRTDYRAMLDSRYAELRNAGVLTVENIVNKVRDNILAFGFENFKAEHEKWPDSFGNGDIEINANWKLVEGVFGSGTTWNANTSYKAGDLVYWGDNSFSGYRQFVCVADNVNERPVILLKVRDSIWRLSSWLTRHQTACDTFYNFNNK